MRLPGASQWVAAMARATARGRVRTLRGVDRAPLRHEFFAKGLLRYHDAEKEKSATHNAGASRCSRTRATRWDRPRHLRLSARGGPAQYCRQGLGPWAFTLRSRGNPTHCRTPQAARESLYTNCPVGMRRKSEETGEEMNSSARTTSFVTRICGSFKVELAGALKRTFDALAHVLHASRHGALQLACPACAGAAARSPC